MAALVSVQSEVNCGGHKAESCNNCPEEWGVVWCNGDCEWINEKCIARGRVTCGDQLIPSCGDCGQCNGDCELIDEECVEIGRVTCGGHRAASCMSCGFDLSWCNGDCEWLDEKCVLKGDLVR